MGLGKTLSMLSLITVYLDHSRGTSLPNNQEDSSHSTLIVTPLSRKLKLPIGKMNRADC